MATVKTNTDVFEKAWEGFKGTDWKEKASEMCIRDSVKEFAGSDNNIHMPICNRIKSPRKHSNLGHSISFLQLPYKRLTHVNGHLTDTIGFLLPNPKV